MASLEAIFWKVLELCCRSESKLLPSLNKVPKLVIAEASQRSDVDECYTSNEGIDRVCKYQVRPSSGFNFLTGLISRIERGEPLFESSPDRGRTDEAGCKTSLVFGDDGLYVPMETTLAEVTDALQKAPIVVLYGGPGSGKSSLSRYLALQLEAASQQRGTGVAASCTAEHSNGVVYMTCGNGAEVISMQRELLRKFNIEVLLDGKSIAMEGTVGLQKMLHQKLVNHLSKLQFRVTVILDDVWDSQLVENLLVPGGRVRYLMTTQISTLWNADVEKVKMQVVALEDARRILGNYAKFEDGVIPKDLQNVADDIIARCGLHPLALATLGIVLEKERTVRGWQAVKNNLEEHLETVDHRPSSFGQRYHLSVDASMLLVLHLLDDSARQLLYKITLFDGPFIPEALLRLFLVCTLPRDKKMKIIQSKLSLVAKGLVQIESENFCFVGHFEMTVLRIHSLRQHFIFNTKEEEIHRIVDFLGDDNDYKFLKSRKRSDLDLATALCALYGKAYVKERALKKMGTHFIWNTEHSSGLVGRLASALKPLVSLMLSEGDTESPISQAAAEVFWNLFIDGRFDDVNIEMLLSEQECFVVTCNLLSELNVLRKTEHLTNNGILACCVEKLPLTLNRLVLLLSSHEGVISRRAVVTITTFALALDNRVAIVRLPSCLKSLVALLAHDVEKGLQEATLTCISQLADCDAKVEMLTTPFLLKRLVLFLSKGMGLRCEIAVHTITGLAIALENRATIVQSPSCLERLIDLLAQDVNKTIQQRVGICFTYLANCDARVEMLATFSLLDRLVLFLSKDVGIMCRSAAGTILGLSVAPENALAIVKSTSCLDRLVALLAQDVDKEIQETVVMCFTYLASCDAKVDMLGTPFLLERLVLLLSEDTGVICESAARVITHLAVAPQNRVAIVQHPSCLDRLVALLAQDVDKTIQVVVVKCFTFLVDCEAHAPENIVAIVQFPSCLERLVALLSQDVEEGIQQAVLSCFCHLVLDSDVVVFMLATPLLMERLVLFLSTDMGFLCQKAAVIIAGLAVAPENRVAIVRSEFCLDRLTSLLADKENQNAAACCFKYLADSDARVDMLGTPFLLERLVLLLSEDIGIIRESAVKAITFLAVAPQNRVAIVQFPSCLDKLVALLSQDVEEKMQQWIVTCLRWLVLCDTKVDILATPGLLERMVLLLSKDTGFMCENAAYTIAALAEAVENRVPIVRFPSCLDRLVALSKQDLDKGVQAAAVRCLHYLINPDVLRALQDMMATS